MNTTFILIFILFIILFILNIVLILYRKQINEIMKKSEDIYLNEINIRDIKSLYHTYKYNKVINSSELRLLKKYFIILILAFLLFLVFVGGMLNFNW